MIRMGQMMGIKPEGLAEYAHLHANPWPEVNAMIKECNIQNYSIFQRGDIMFAYFEYVGDDFDADMAKMAADPTTQKWWATVKPLMNPLEDREPGEFWAGMKPLYYLA